MSVPPSRSARAAGAFTRREETFHFIVECAIRGRTSPSFEEIGVHLGVGKSRVKELVGQLVRDGLIERPIGAQRAIVVRGLKARIAIETLRREGWLIDEEIRRGRARGHPQEHLPLVAIIEHSPDLSEGDEDADRTAA